jgi:hypothetical protein
LHSILPPQERANLENCQGSVHGEYHQVQTVIPVIMALTNPFTGNGFLLITALSFMFYIHVNYSLMFPEQSGG